MASRSAIFLVILNIAFATLTHANDSRPFLNMASASTHLSSNLNGGCSCNADPVGVTACGVLISGNFSPIPVRSCCKALSPVSKKEAVVCLGNAIENETAEIGNVDVSAAVHTTLTVCNKI